MLNALGSVISSLKESARPYAMPEGEYRPVSGFIEPNTAVTTLEPKAPTVRILAYIRASRPPRSANALLLLRGLFDFEFPRAIIYDEKKLGNKFTALIRLFPM